MTMTTKPPAHSADAETALIGYALQWPVETMSFARNRGISADWFYLPANRTAWEIVESIQPERLGYFVAKDEATRKGVLDEIGGDIFLNKALSLAITVAQMPPALDILHDYFVQRRLRSIALGLLEAVETPGAKLPNEIAADVQADLMTLAPRGATRNRPQVYNDVMASIEARAVEGFQGIPARWREVNRLLGGYRPGKLYVIAARPGDGKSAHCCNEIRWLAQQPFRVSVASLEMDDDEMTERMLCEDADESAFRIQQGRHAQPPVSRQQIDRLRFRADVHQTYPIRVNERRITVEEFSAWAAGEVLCHGAQIIYLDYLQYLASSKKFHSRNDEVTAWCNTIADTAKRLQVPIVAYSQMSRAQQHEKNRRPGLHDLRESGGIEQAAYAVMFIYHERDQETNDILSTRFIVAKHRGGPSGDIPMVFNRTKIRFEEPGQANSPSPTPPPVAVAPPQPLPAPRLPYRDDDGPATGPDADQSPF